MNFFKLIIVLLVIIFTIITCLNPIYPKEQFLQHAGTALILLPLFFDIRKDRLGIGTFIAYIFFIIIHIIGARYIYSMVPYNSFFEASLGVNINDVFGFERNHYDRFVHFSFGLLLLPYFNYRIIQWGNLSKGKALIIALFALQTFSMLYEIFEWLLTVFMSSEAADNYNGQQGDMWDAQKDMALALLGSLLAALVLFVRKNK